MHTCTDTHLDEVYTLACVNLVQKSFHYVLECCDFYMAEACRKMTRKIAPVTLLGPTPVQVQDPTTSPRPHYKSKAPVQVQGPTKSPRPHYKSKTPLQVQCPTTSPRPHYKFKAPLQVQGPTRRVFKFRTRPDRPPTVRPTVRPSDRPTDTSIIITIISALFTLVLLLLFFLARDYVLAASCSPGLMSLI